MNILFNSSGIPLLMQSTYIFCETTGTPQNEMKERTRILAAPRLFTSSIFREV